MKSFFRISKSNLLGIACSLFIPFQIHAQQAGAHIIVDATTGYVLSENNSSKKLPVASLTKIATAMVVLDWAEQRGLDVNQMATVPQFPSTLTAVNPIGLAPGDRLTLRDLIYAAMLQSDNIAAETLAHHVGTTLTAEGDASPVDRFVAQMNALAARLKMERTLFLNPHGQDAAERKTPYSTASDMARLCRYAMAKPAFRFYVSQTERKITILKSAGSQNGYLLKNTNQLVGVQHIDGIKTGTTRKAGECLAISSARSPESRQEGDKHFITPRRLIVVVLNTSNRFQYASSLLNKGWQQYDSWASAGRPMKKSDTL